MTKRIPSLDGLRALAIILVLIGHSAHGLTAAGLPGPGLIYALRLSTAGVAVFFVLSGFLITRLLTSEKERTGTISLRNFYLRRFFRIVPAYYTFLLVMLAVAAVGAISIPRAGVLPAFLFTWNYSPHADGWWFGHAWTLSMEEQFYILWPAIVGALSPRWTARIAVLVIALSPILRVLTYAVWPAGRGLIPAMLHTHGDALMFGALAALWWDHPKFQRALDWCFQKKLHVLALVMLIADEYVMWRLRGGFALPVGMTVESATIALMLAWAVRHPDAAVGRILNWRPLAFVGAISYSLYLWQQAFLRPVEPSWTSRFPISVLLAVAAGLASYYLVERPFLRLRDHVVGRSRRRFSVSPADAA